MFVQSTIENVLTLLDLTQFGLANRCWVMTESVFWLIELASNIGLCGQIVKDVLLNSIFKYVCNFISKFENFYEGALHLKLTSKKQWLADLLICSIKQVELLLTQGSLKCTGHFWGMNIVFLKIWLSLFQLVIETVFRLTIIHENGFNKITFRCLFNFQADYKNKGDEGSN